MDDATSPQQDSPRRGALAAGLIAALGAAGVAGVTSATRADAAAGQAIYMGKSNDAGTTSTVVTTSSPGSGFKVYQYGAGVAAYFWSAGSSGLGGGTQARNAYGMWALALGSSTGTGCALRAEGRNNMAIDADTSAPGVAAIRATGGGGDQALALWGIGNTLADGHMQALQSWVGVNDTSATDGFSYAAVASGESSYHQQCDEAVLNGSGAAVITLSSQFLDAVDIATLSVIVTPKGAAMPNLYVTTSSSGFTISSGAANGSVFYTATAQRLAMSLAHGTAAGQIAAAAPSAPSAPVVPPARRARPAIHHAR